MESKKRTRISLIITDMEHFQQTVSFTISRSSPAFSEGFVVISVVPNKINKIINELIKLNKAFQISKYFFYYLYLASFFFLPNTCCSMHYAFMSIKAIKTFNSSIIIVTPSPFGETASSHAEKNKERPNFN